MKAHQPTICSLSTSCRAIGIAFSILSICSSYPVHCKLAGHKHPVRSPQPVTIVTALFDIGGRSMEEYLGWFEHLLRIKTPMVVFTDQPAAVDLLMSARVGMQTDIYLETTEDIPYYPLKPRIQEIIDDPEFGKQMKDMWRTEVRLAMYTVVQYSKFPWLLKVASMNPFNSTWFWWMDAGLGRWSTAGEGKHWPNWDKLQEFDSDKLVAQMHKQMDSLPTDIDVEKYIWDSKCYIPGGIWGGTKRVLMRLALDMDKMLREEMLGKGLINNEQIAFYILWRRDPDFFHLLPGHCPPDGCKAWFDNFITMVDTLA